MDLGRDRDRDRDRQMEHGHEEKREFGSELAST
jgi:hypothetical protein